MSQSKNVRIIPATNKKTISAAQKRFNTLSKKIDQQKKLLLEWKETIPVYRQKIEQEYDVLADEFNRYRTQMVLLFDQYYDHKLFKKTDKAKLKHLICTISSDLIAEVEDVEELKALFNKYSEEDYDEINQEADVAIGDMMKSMVETMFKVKLDDDVDISSPEKFRAHLEEKMQTAQENNAPEKERKKTKKQLEKEARQQQEDELAGQSVREVYRKLVAVLHPDREPDEQERARKTELMQRVNTAYGKKDLLQLLSLQLEIEQINPEHLSNIADSRLKHFNKILNEQLAELEQQNSMIEMMIKADFNEPFWMSLSPQRLMQIVAEDINTGQNDIVQIKQELEDFQKPEALKLWLKNYKIQKAPTLSDLEDDWFMDDMGLY